MSDESDFEFNVEDLLNNTLSEKIDDLKDSVRQTVFESKKMKGDDPCWDDYEMVGHKMKNGKKVPNCVKKEESEVEEAPGQNYYKIGGDPYDGGTVLKVVIKGKEVHSDIRDGDHDWKYKGRKFNHIDKLIAAIARDHRVSPSQIKRVQMEEFMLEEAEVFFDEETGEEYYFEEDAETLEERKIVIRINSKGQRIKRIKCGNGRVARKVNGRLVCVTPTGREKLTKKLAIKRSVRTKRAKGAGFKKRVNFKRQRALRKRRQMGLPKQESVQEARMDKYEVRVSSGDSFKTVKVSANSPSEARQKAIDSAKKKDRMGRSFSADNVKKIANAGVTGNVDRLGNIS